MGLSGSVWGIILGGWELVGMGGVEWGWVHGLVMPFANRRILDESSNSMNEKFFLKKI